MPPPGGPLHVHASCVCVDGKAILIRGASGRGKSGLSLALLALGAGLVSDDQTVLSREGDAVIARAPAAIAGGIEARGIGILRAPTVPQAPVTVVIDLDLVEEARLPPQREVILLEKTLPLLHKVESPYFPAAILQYVSHGLWTHTRHTPPA